MFKIKIIFDIEKLLFGIIDRIKKNTDENKKKKTEMQKLLKQFEKELQDGQAKTISLINGNKLSKLKVNDVIFKSHLSDIKFTAMKTVMDYSDFYDKLRTKNNNQFFDTLSLTLFKIEQLKKLSKMSDQKLSYIPTVNLTKRIKNINKCFVKLISGK